MLALESLWKKYLVGSASKIWGCLELLFWARQCYSEHSNVTLNISREDSLKKQEWALSGLRFFDAPNGIVFYYDRALNHWSLLDIGLLLQNIMLAALNYGLGTCTETTVTRFPDILRALLHIPESKIIVCGMAIGYPLEEDPVNQYVSPREPLEKISSWHGF